MTRVYLYALMLIAGMLWGQLLPGLLDPEVYPPVVQGIRLVLTWALAFLMVYVGYEFEVNSKGLKEYAYDYAVAALTGALPWLMVAFYVLYVMTEPGAYDWVAWKKALLHARWAGPSSAGLLLTFVATAGLARSWVYRKLRVIAIDVDTLLLIIPIKILAAGELPQTAFLVGFIALMLVVIWRYRHTLRIPATVSWVMVYAVGLTALVDLIGRISRYIDPEQPVHLEVILPAFALGCAMQRMHGGDPHSDDHREGHIDGPESPVEQRKIAAMSGVFMILVGLALPPLTIDPESGTLLIDRVMRRPEFREGRLEGISDRHEMLDMSHIEDWPPPEPRRDLAVRLRKFLNHPIFSPLDVRDFRDWRVYVYHVLIVSILANLMKMVPVLMYSGRATLRERVALSLLLQTRGEEGAGVLVMSLAYGLSGPIVTVMMLALTLNMLQTPFVVSLVKYLLTDLAVSHHELDEISDASTPYQVRSGPSSAQRRKKKKRKTSR